MRMIRANFVWVALAAVVCGGCGVERNALPGELLAVARPMGISGVRDWGWRPSELFQRDMVESIHQGRKHSETGFVDAEGYANILALSGGGSRGVFAAGFLAGWSESGRRPEFKLVTGVSTGALIAPFAFLGEAYDKTLGEFYTSIETDDVMKRKPLLGVLAGDDSISSTAPLRALIARAYTAEMLAKIAAEHRRGRRLYVLTTNLDARRPVVWNMGAIAASGHPNALKLFREILLASGSIPAAMDPVYLPVLANGTLYDEMHVDGGVTSEVFFYGFMLDLDAGMRDGGIAENDRAKIRIYILRNEQLRVPYTQVPPRVLAVGRRAIDALIARQAIGDLFRIYTITQRDGTDFNLMYIPDDAPAMGSVEFDPEAMSAMYDLGRRLGREGCPWRKAPIDFVKPAPAPTPASASAPARQP